MTRFIGIQHRRKRTTEGEVRPTRVCFAEEGEFRHLDLDDDTAEKDFMLGRFPVEFRAISQGEDISSFPQHHVKWRKLKKDENHEQFPAELIRLEDKTWFLAEKIPVGYEGLQAGDIVGMVLGGSGDRLAHALSRRGEEIGASVWRIPPFRLKERRSAASDRDKDNDAGLLAELVRDARDEFYLITPRERELIRLIEQYRWRQEAMKARIGCEQRLLQRVVGNIFLSEEGRFPEGRIEDEYDGQRADDNVYQLALTEERERERELTAIVAGTQIYRELFAPLEGVGPMIAARLIVAIRDIRRFSSKAKLKAYLGAHLLALVPEAADDAPEIPEEDALGITQAHKKTPKAVLRALQPGETYDGQFYFARRRSGAVANWQPDGRQALYLLAEQFNRRPLSVWGLRLRHYKEVLRQRHPDTVCKECGCKWDDCVSKKSHTRKYSDGHIHKMALWRTATKFVEWLFRAWWDLERRIAASPQSEAATISGDVNAEQAQTAAAAL